ncbi:MAG: hypothetical protein J2P48_08565 [Alphaproteobacteria bacterium]|nr:hypothetical protein [Alphaproteobacteria bacterium]
MPRPSPLTRLSIKLDLSPLSGCWSGRFARLLGLEVLPDFLADRIAVMIATHRAAREPQQKNARDRRAKGHTPARVAAGLRRIESRMRRGHDDPETTREITDPLFGMDVETITRLGPIVADPDVPLGRKSAAIAARRREVEALPGVDPRYGLRVVLVAQAAAQIWYYYAVRRDDRPRQWQFLLAMLEAAGEGTGGLRQHPERIKRDVGRLLELTSEP